MWVLVYDRPHDLGLRPDGRAIGLFAATARRGQVEVAPDGVEFAFEGGGYELFVFQGDHPRDVLAAYTALIGRAPAPPRWALGYHQCRWSYGSEAEVRALVDEIKGDGFVAGRIAHGRDILGRELWHRPVSSTPCRHTIKKPRRMPKELHGTNRDRSSGFNSPPCRRPDGKRAAHSARGGPPTCFFTPCRRGPNIRL